MDCYPIDDYCKLFNEAFEVPAEDKFDDLIEIGVFNGKKYSFTRYGDKPVIVIEYNDKTDFLVDKGE